MLEDEYDQVAIITQPNITYKCKIANKDELITVTNPAEAPREELIRYWQESIVSANIITPDEYSKEVMSLCEERRGEQISVDYMEGTG